MEKEELFSNEDSTMFPDFGMEIHSNYGSEQLPNCYFNPNWGNPMDQSDPFESALSSMVSSPAASNAAAAGGGGGGDGVVLRELIGRLGSICNSGEISPHSFINGNNSTNTSCYSTPLNSPPKLNLSMMDQQIRANFANQGYHFPSSFTPLSTDPGFVERAARFSCFGTRNLGLNESELPNRLVPTMESGKFSRVSSNQSIRISGSPMGLQGNKDGKFSKLSRSSSPENGEESSSVSEQIPNAEMGMKSQTQSEENTSRKRKSIPRGKGKETKSPSPSKTDPPKLAGENDESNIKRTKPDEATGNGKVEKGKSGAKPPSPAEPPKDYIHVRARRGQATDSHSLAERVRREKISERMKYLQDLVPGCDKVTGKAVMLDEIINYVQSLQRQVEFLSMKLATVNPRMDFNTEAARLSKDDTRGSIPHNIFPLETNTFPHGYQSSMAPFSSALQRNPSTQLPPIDAFSEAASQASAFWEDDLLSFVQMGFGQNQPQNFHAGSGTGKMKVEL